MRYLRNAEAVFLAVAWVVSSVWIVASIVWVLLIPPGQTVIVAGERVFALVGGIIVFVAVTARGIARFSKEN